MIINALPYALLFLSGFAGLGYEMVWTCTLTAALGHEIVAVLAVVAAFFSGMALGAWTLDRIIGSSNRPECWYGGLELAIGLWALLLALAMPWADRLAAAWIGVNPGPLRHWVVAFLFPFAALLPATMAMGGTLPAVERRASRRSPEN